MTVPVVLCCGEAVMDLVPAPLADGGTGFAAVPGGAALNTAVALSRLAVPSGFIGALSSDPMGATLGAHLCAEGVDCALTLQFDAPSTIALTHPQADGTRFDLYDTGSANRAVTADHLKPLPDGVSTLVLGGISLIHDPAATAFETLARSAPRCLIWLDLNIRPGLVGDPIAYKARLRRLMELADILKVSDEDLDCFGPLPPLRPDQMLLHTHGASGASAHLGDLSASAPAPAVDVRDTVGAGDIFAAGVLSQLYKSGVLQKPLALGQTDLLHALTAGIRTASLSVSRTGADAPTLKEVECAP